MNNPQCFIVAIGLCLVLTGCTKNLEDKTKNLEDKTKDLENKISTFEINNKKENEKILSDTIKGINVVEQRIKLIEEKYIKQETQLISIQALNKKLENRIEKLNDILIAKNQQESQDKVARKKEELRRQFSSLKKVNDATDLGINSKDYAKLILDSKDDVELLANNSLLDEKTRKHIKECWTCYEDVKHFWTAFLSMVNSNTTISGGGMARNIVEELVIPNSGIDSRQNISELVKGISGNFIFVGPVVSVLWSRASSNYDKAEIEIEKIMKKNVSSE